MDVKRVQVAVANDHALMRHGIKHIVNSSGLFEVCVDVSSGGELVSFIRNAQHPPAVCILDTNINYQETLKTIRHSWPDVKVIIFSLFRSDFMMQEMRSHGANGFLERTCSDTCLLQALNAVTTTDKFFAGEQSVKLSTPRRHHAITRISEREAEFLSHCCSDLSYKDISVLMGVSVRTVESFRDTLFEKLKLNTRTALAMFALQNGLTQSGNHTDDIVED